jgi:hypothetical protein
MESLVTCTRDAYRSFSRPVLPLFTECVEGEFYEVRAPYCGVDFIMCLGEG